MHPEALTDDGKRLFPQLSKFDGFYLASGTALALQLGHRVSIDFDLFSPEQIGRNLFVKVKRVFSGESISPLVNNPDELTLKIGSVKVTFLHYPFPILESLFNQNGLNLLSPFELAATKAYTIGRRGEYKDYVDLFFYLKNGDGPNNTLNKIIELANRKYGSEFNDRLFLEQLVFLDDVVETNLQFIRPAIDKKIIADFFQEETRKIKL